MVLSVASHSNNFIADKRRHRTQDTISTLVNIYGSSELFVNEYRTLLADRLLAITDYDVDKEVRAFDYFILYHFNTPNSSWWSVP